MVLQPQPSQVEGAARRWLARATTERTALILLDQYHGALSRELSKIEAEMGEGRCAAARGRVVQLLRHAPLGLHLTRPWRVVLAGPPNVGKSSLINAIVGYQRAVVYDAPGTTRDVVTVPTAIDGWPIELSDTAGIRPATDTLETAGIGRARREVEQADLVIWVQEATESNVQSLETDTAQIFDASSDGHSANVLRVLNKCDCLAQSVFATPHDDHQAKMRNTERLLFTSALTGQGVPQLLSAISQQLVPEPPPPGAAVPFLEEHVAYLRGLLACLAA
jgi:tRNA modification GTPase